jgi:hypothetical protein
VILLSVIAALGALGSVALAVWATKGRSPTAASPRDAATIHVTSALVTRDELDVAIRLLRDDMDREIRSLREYVLQLRNENAEDRDRTSGHMSNIVARFAEVEQTLRAVEGELSRLESQRLASVDELRSVRELARFALIRLGAADDLLADDMSIDVD